MPRSVAGIAGRLAEHQAAIDQNVVSDDAFHGVEDRRMGHQTKGPIKPQMKVFDPLQHTF